jgi:hypothetical protein
VPVFDLKIHPRDRELIAATHGRGFWIVDVSALEQITPKTLAENATLFAPRTAFQWGEGPTLGLPGNGYGQAPLVIPSPPYGANITYRLKDSVAAPVRVTVSDAAGTQLFTTTGPNRRGVHTVQWAFTGAPAPRRELTPAERRDSILLRARAPMVLDSLKKAGYDTLALNQVRRVVTAATNPQAAGGPGGGAFGGRGGGAGGGQFGRANVGCEHPTTMWDTFCARPAEPGVSGGRGGRGAQADTSGEAGGGVGAGAANAGRRGGAAAALDPVQRVWDIIGMRPPVVAGRGFGGGGGGFGALFGNLADAGAYTVTLQAGGQTLKQTFRVERVGTGDNAALADQQDDEDDADINGGIFPKQDASPFVVWWW